MLVGPVVKGCRADDEVERAVWVANLFGGPEGETQSVVVSDTPRDGDHLGCGVNAPEPRGIRVAVSQHPQQITGSASHVEHARGGGDGCHGQIGGAIRDLVVHPARQPWS